MYMYRQNLALNNPKVLISHKTRASELEPSKWIKFYIIPRSLSRYGKICKDILHDVMVRKLVLC